jgi:hypothetical protein
LGEIYKAGRFSLTGVLYIPGIVVGLLVLFLVYELWDEAEDIFLRSHQQRAIRAFDRYDMIDSGKPNWAIGKKKPNRK